MFVSLVESVSQQPRRVSESPIHPLLHAGTTATPLSLARHVRASVYNYNYNNSL